MSFKGAHGVTYDHAFWTLGGSSNNDSDKPGFMTEIATAAFGTHDIDVKYEVLNWSRVLRLTHKGRIDGALAANLWGWAILPLWF